VTDREIEQVLADELEKHGVAYPHGVALQQLAALRRAGLTVTHAVNAVDGHQPGVELSADER
jgi:hypothetical protein